MHVIRARNVNDALPQAVKALQDNGIPGGSRAGDVIVYPEPVTTVYSRPTERVLFYPKRDANPFLHFFEGLWLLASRNDVKFLTRFAKDYVKYSDDGVTLRGAYGYRWRKHWGFDQIPRIINLLRREPNSRRAILQMWDPEADLRDEEKTYTDVPCNVSIAFGNCAGRLNMTVFCRSNDLVLGAMGTNVVCLSMLQEYMAAMVGWQVGTYRQVSVNLHAYLDTWEKVKDCVDLQNKIQEDLTTLKSILPVESELTKLRQKQMGILPDDPYLRNDVKPYPMVIVPATWDRDLALFLEEPATNGCEDPFLAQVAKPPWWAHVAYSTRADPDRFDKAREILQQCRATDWRRAAEEWIDRRAERFTKAG